MGLALFSITSRNPNDFAGGGGGCMCSPVKTSQCTPPYCTFQGTEMLEPRSPIPVLSLHCAKQFLERVCDSPNPIPPQPKDALEPDFPTPASGAAAEAELVADAKKRGARKAAL